MGPKLTPEMPRVCVSHCSLFAFSSQFLCVFHSISERLFCCLLFLSLMSHGSNQTLRRVLHPISFIPKVWFVAQDGPQLYRLALCGAKGLEPLS